jgi:hypothetical protein
MSNDDLICPLCRTEPCYLSCEIPAYILSKTKELKESNEDLNTKYKAAMERIATLTRNTQ